MMTMLMVMEIIIQRAKRLRFFDKRFFAEEHTRHTGTLNSRILPSFVPLHHLLLPAEANFRATAGVDLPRTLILSVSIRGKETQSTGLKTLVKGGPAQVFY